MTITAFRLAAKVAVPLTSGRIDTPTSLCRRRRLIQHARLHQCLQHQPPRYGWAIWSNLASGSPRGERPVWWVCWTEYKAQNVKFCVPELAAIERVKTAHSGGYRMCCITADRSRSVARSMV